MFLFFSSSREQGSSLPWGHRNGFLVAESRQPRATERVSLRGLFLVTLPTTHHSADPCVRLLQLIGLSQL